MKKKEEEAAPPKVENLKPNCNNGRTGKNCSLRSTESVNVTDTACY